MLLLLLLLLLLLIWRRQIHAICRHKRPATKFRHSLFDVSDCVQRYNFELLPLTKCRLSAETRSFSTTSCRQRAYMHFDGWSSPKDLPQRQADDKLFDDLPTTSWLQGFWPIADELPTRLSPTTCQRIANELTTSWRQGFPTSCRPIFLEAWILELLHLGPCPTLLPNSCRQVAEQSADELPTRCRQRDD